MGFRFTIVDVQAGEVVGTNDEKVAKAFAQSDEFFVVDNGEIRATPSQWMLDEVNTQPVREQDTYKFD